MIHKPYEVHQEMSSFRGFSSSGKGDRRVGHNWPVPPLMVLSFTSHKSHPWHGWALTALVLSYIKTQDLMIFKVLLNSEFWLVKGRKETI